LLVVDLPANPGFVGGTDYHLTADSPATILDVIDCADKHLEDYDGELRPQGAKCDLGADEFRPKGVESINGAAAANITASPLMGEPNEADRMPEAP